MKKFGRRLLSIGLVQDIKLEAWMEDIQVDLTEILLRCGKGIALALWVNPLLFDLAENLTQCREYHREQLCNWLKVGRSLGLTCGGQKVRLPLCASGMRVNVRTNSEATRSFSAATRPCAAPLRSNFVGGIFIKSCGRERCGRLF
jgi:hypothetical protein